MRQTYNPIVRTFNRFRAALLADSDWERHDIRPDTPLDVALPAESRRELWRHLVEEGFRLPPLELPSPEVLRNFFWLVRVSVSFSLLFSVFWGWLTFLSGGVAAYWVSRPYAIELPDGLETVGDAVLYLTSVADHKGSGYRWTHNEISFKVRMVIAHCLAIPFDEVQPHNSFDDLGAD